MYDYSAFSKVNEQTVSVVASFRSSHTTHFLVYILHLLSKLDLPAVFCSIIFWSHIISLVNRYIIRKKARHYQNNKVNVIGTEMTVLGTHHRNQKA